MLENIFQVFILENRDELGKIAAGKVAETIRNLLIKKPEISMVFGAAPSQNEFFFYLTSENNVDWSRVHAFHMDEYIGLPAGSEQSFRTYLDEHVFSKVPFKSVHYINGNVAGEEIEKECERYTQLLKKHPVDISCLGIGENGHIAFNDPHNADFGDKKWVKVVDMDQACRQQQVNDGCFGSLEKVPTHAITLTIPALLSGTHLFCAVPSRAKAVAVKNTIYGKVSEKCPASILRLHPSVKLFLDADSSSLLDQY
ncbi:MAG: glucosamine-6-phosphate deaminase [Mangrovibacterium sp.]